MMRLCSGNHGVGANENRKKKRFMGMEIYFETNMADFVNVN